MKKTISKKPEAIVWHHFTRHNDAIFLSLKREIRIGVLSVATLAVACPDSSAAVMAMGQHPTTEEQQSGTDASSTETDNTLLDLTALQHGDLLFNLAGASRDGIAQAIVSSTEGINLQKVSHVAIVCQESDGQFYALEASGKHGVHLTPISSYFAQSDHNTEGYPLVLLGRLNDTSCAAASVARAKTYLGRPYDHQYLPGDSALYCSELVHYAYLDADGTPLFPQHPMSFHDNTGHILPFWTEYYRQWGMPVPEGMPGTNPGGISRSNQLHIVGQFFPSESVMLHATEVTATRAPLPTDKAVRLVQVINRQDIENASAHSVNDLLKLAAGVDVRQRGGFGIQTDIGVNGGTEDQLTVLLNGVNISNPHTGHLTVDLPVSVDDIERIEVIEGGASRIYGSQAFAGAINIVTRTETESTLGAHLQGGSYGTLGTNAYLSLKSPHFNHRISGSYTRSDGGTSNDDFNKGNAFWNGKYRSAHLDATIQAGFSTMNYGANTFYGTGSDTQYEEDRRYLLAAQAEYKGRIRVPVQLYWNRSLDHYVWWRANPAAYQNFHQTNVYGANANAHTTWGLGQTAIGIEFRRENILSTRLGKEIPESEQHKYKVPGHDEYYRYKDGRSNLGLYLEHDLLLKHLTLSIGILANHNTSVSGSMRLYPGIDLSWQATERWELYASFNQSLRTPTYTDIYYNGPGLQGNTHLKPEQSTDWHLGASYTGDFFRMQVKGFYRKGTDMIDWVKYPDATVYTTANSDIDDIGAEALSAFDFTQRWGKQAILQRFSLGYSYSYKYRVHTHPITLNSLTFLRHKFVASLHHRIVSHLTAQWDFTLKNREGEFDNAQTGQRQRFGTYGNLDLKVQWVTPHYTLYVQGNNVTDHPYYDFANIQQPGLWLMTGAKLHLW